MLIYKGNLRKKSQLGAEKITFPPKRCGHKDRRTDICFYRVALLLKNLMQSEIKLIDGKFHKIEIKFPIDFELCTNAVEVRKLGFYM